MVQITINGNQMEVPEGTTVLRAAEMAGIHIPRLCDHKALTPYGGCRLCIVEVQGVLEKESGIYRDRVEIGQLRRAGFLREGAGDAGPSLMRPRGAALGVNESNRRRR